MARTRQWRRFQTERKFLRILKRIRNENNWRFDQINNQFNTLYSNFRYSRRLSQSEVIELSVQSSLEWERYEVWQARTKRDNQQNCGCYMCNQGFRERNDWLLLSVSEKRYYVNKNKRHKIDWESEY